MRDYDIENSPSADESAEIANKTKQAVTSSVQMFKEKTQQLGRTAVDAIEQNRVSAAGALHNAAASLHENASKMPDGPDLAHSAAEKVDAVSGYLQKHDTKQMMADVKTVMKRNPGPSLLMAGILGFLIGRSVRNN